MTSGQAHSDRRVSTRLVEVAAPLEPVVGDSTSIDLSTAWHAGGLLRELTTAIQRPGCHGYHNLLRPRATWI
jgi:hypothetical protein